MDPPLELVNAIGISGNVASSLLLHEADDAAHIVYPLGSTLVIRNVEDASDQIFLRGVWPHPLITGAHTRPSSGDCWHVMSKLRARSRAAAAAANAIHHQSLALLRSPRPAAACPSSTHRRPNIVTHPPLPAPPTAHTQAISCVTMSADQTRLASGTRPAHAKCATRNGPPGWNPTVGQRSHMGFLADVIVWDISDIKAPAMLHKLSLHKVERQIDVQESRGREKDGPPLRILQRPGAKGAGRHSPL